MSVYYQARGLSFDMILEDVRLGMIEGVSVDETAKARSEDERCLTDGTYYGWLLREEEETVGLKQWGMNDVMNIISKLQEFYGVKFVDEWSLGIMHLG